MTWRPEQKVTDRHGVAWTITAVNGSPVVSVWSPEGGHATMWASDLRPYRQPTLAFDEDTLAAVSLAGCAS